MRQQAEDLPRVLIVTVNPLSATSNNGKTYASFFESYPRDRIGQLYFHRELPTSDVCSNYYRISDEDALRFTLGRVALLGARVDSQTASERFLRPTTTRALAAIRVIRLARSAVLARMLTRGKASRNAWMQELRPDLIFFCGGDATYLYPLVEEIADDLDIPIVTYITDDYVLPTPSRNPLTWLTRRIVRAHFLRVCERSALILTIGDKMTEEYAKRFGIRSRPIMNLISAPLTRPPEPPKTDRKSVELCYAGGLHLTRWRVLAEIGACLDRVADRGAEAELHIYTATPINGTMYRALSRHRRIILHERASQSELECIYSSADLLVHVESFASGDRASTRLSISTKIPEYLAAGRSILAVGPCDVASIEYLHATKAAFVVCSLDESELDSVLYSAISDSEQRERQADHGFVVARQNHDAEQARRQLWEDFADITNAPRPKRLGFTGKAESK